MSEGIGGAREPWSTDLSASAGTQGLLLAVADVMGKGLPAALFATVFRTLLRARPELARSPGPFVDWLNQNLVSELGENALVLGVLRIDQLRVVGRCVWAGGARKRCARVRHRRIEPKRVEVVAQIVVLGDVLPGAFLGIGARQVISEILGGAPVEAALLAVQNVAVLEEIAKQRRQVLDLDIQMHGHLWLPLGRRPHRADVQGLVLDADVVARVL